MTTERYNRGISVDTLSGISTIDGPVTVEDGLYQEDEGIVAKPTRETTTDITLYVRTTGSDTNDGLTVANALETIQEAVNRVPSGIGHTVLIDIGAGDFDGAYVAGFYETGGAGARSFTIKGVLDNPTLTTGTTSGTATSGTTRSVTDSGQSWTPDELIGYLALVGSTYRTIYTNSATAFSVVGAFPSSTSGKAYSILEQKTNIDTAEPVTSYGGLTFRGNHIQVQVQDLRMTGILIGLVNMYTEAGAEPTRVRADSCTYAGFFSQDALQELEYHNCAAIGCQVGFTFTQASYLRKGNDLLAYNSTAEGFRAYSMDAGNVNFDDIAAISNGTDGLYLININVLVDIDTSRFTDNGGYGIHVGTSTDPGYFSSGGRVDLNATVTVSDNTLGGILVDHYSTISLTNVDGTGNGNYGLELRMGSYAIITSATGITGSSGDATINGGTTALTWTTDFASDGDTVANPSNGCKIERKD